jgi:isochorismate hydrolase
MNKPIRQLLEGKPALLVIDERGPTSPWVPQLIEAGRRHHVPIIFADGLSTGVATGTSRRSNDYAIARPRSSAFYGTPLQILLKDLGARTLILAGGETSVSVHYTFVDAHQHDYFCRVVEDSMSGSSAPAHEAALKAMEYMQTGARRTCSEVIAAFDSL